MKKKKRKITVGKTVNISGGQKLQNEKEKKCMGYVRFTNQLFN